MIHLKYSRISLKMTHSLIKTFLEIIMVIEMGWLKHHHLGMILMMIFSHQCIRIKIQIFQEVKLIKLFNLQLQLCNIIL